MFSFTRTAYKLSPWNLAHFHTHTKNFPTVVKYGIVKPDKAFLGRPQQGLAELTNVCYV